MAKITMDWFVAAVIRAVRTAAQTALSMFTIGMAIKDVDWMNIVSVALVAAAYSILTSIATGLPEAADDGLLVLDDSGDTTRMLFRVDTEDFAGKKSIRLKVKEDTIKMEGENE